MALQIHLRKGAGIILQAHLLQQPAQCFASSAPKVRAQIKRQELNAAAAKASGKVEDMGKSIAAKGFLRPVKSFTAPVDAADKVKSICAALQIQATPNNKLENMEQKFKFLEACHKDFQHAVPNSQLHEIRTVGDVIDFYQTSVDTTVPYDALKKMDLPENLHIQYDYVRFQPQTDTKFNGQTAYPKSSTLVTGLKYREKYQGHEAKRSWP